jgi:hypothetical protein
MTPEDDDIAGMPPAFQSWIRAAFTRPDARSIKDLRNDLRSLRETFLDVAIHQRSFVLKWDTDELRPERETLIAASRTRAVTCDEMVERIDRVRAKLKAERDRINNPG